jgi:hypothetical protein
MNQRNGICFLIVTVIGQVMLKAESVLLALLFTYLERVFVGDQKRRRGLYFK